MARKKTTPTELNNFADLPEALKTALGNLTLRFGQVEHLLAVIIHRATRDPWDDVFAQLGYGGNLRNRRTLLREVKSCLSKLPEATQADERTRRFEEIRAGLLNALQSRDEITHCAWGIDGQGNVTGTRHGQLMSVDGQPAGWIYIEEVAEKLWEYFKILNLICPLNIPPSGPSDDDLRVTPMEVFATAASCGGPPMVKVGSGSSGS